MLEVSKSVFFPINFLQPSLAKILRKLCMQRNSELQVLYDTWLAEQVSLSEAQAFERFCKSLRELNSIARPATARVAAPISKPARGHRFFEAANKVIQQRRQRNL